MKELLRKYISGNAFDKERRKVLDWANESKENEKELIQMETDWVFETLPDTELSNVAAISKSIFSSRKIKTFRVLSGVAAAILIFFTVFSLVRNERLNEQIGILTAENIRLTEIPELVQIQSTLEYHVNPGVVGHILLPDSSLVILNSATTLKSPSVFENGKRVVELDGEAYFNVKHNSDWPMYVRTKKGLIVKVTGTEFNLSSYKNDDNIKLTLVEGKVSIMTDKQDAEVAVKEKEEIVIPNNASISEIKRKVADMRLNTSWKDGYLVFDNTPIEEVIKKMERWYGVKINIKNKAVRDNVFTASFNSESLRQVLDLMNFTCGIKFKIKDTVVDLY